MFIKNIREKCGFSQKEVAEKLQISHNALCQYEKGKRNPKVEILIKLSELFGCTIDELVKGEKENETSDP